MSFNPGIKTSTKGQKKQCADKYKARFQTETHHYEKNIKEVSQ